jgi:hypothetical protein
MRERNSIEKVLKDATKQNLGAPENSYKRFSQVCDVVAIVHPHRENDNGLSGKI